MNESTALDNGSAVRADPRVGDVDLVKMVVVKLDSTLSFGCDGHTFGGPVTPGPEPRVGRLEPGYSLSQDGERSIPDFFLRKKGGLFGRPC